MGTIRFVSVLCMMWLVCAAACVREIPEDEIWYEASGKLNEWHGNGTSGFVPDAFSTSISSHTFADGKGVMRFNGSLTTIDEWAFSQCNELTSVTIPNSVTSIGKYAFSDSRNLKSVDLPNSIDTLQDRIFAYCTSLESVVIPESVKRIGKYAFECCENLKSVTIPNSVTSIGGCSFIHCSSLTDVTIPNSVTSIDDGAFFYCTGLNSIRVQWDEPLSVPDDVFDQVDKAECTLYVPKGTSSAYKAAPVWKEFNSIRE